MKRHVEEKGEGEGEEAWEGKTWKEGPASSSMPRRPVNIPECI